MKMRLLTLKTREDLHTAWKVQAAAEGSTMSRMLERLIEKDLKSRSAVARRAVHKRNLRRGARTAVHTKKQQGVPPAHEEEGEK